MKINFLLLLLAIATAIGCSKQKETPLTNNQLLAKQPWVLKAYTTVRISDGVTQDGYGPMSLCYKDDEYIFKLNNTYEGNAGAAKCDPADPQVFQTGTWQLINSDTKLQRVITTGFGIGTIEFIVMSLTATELKISTADATYNHILTYSH